MILSKTEQAALKQGKRRTIIVKKHERKIIMRAEQSIKDRTIESFAVSFLGQCERYGVSAADVRHVRNLIALFRARGLPASAGGLRMAG